MKTIYQSLIFSTLFFFQLNVLSAQDGCGLTDPLFDYEPDIDLCCGIQYYEVCYDVDTVEQVFGIISPSNPLDIVEFIHPKGTWSGYIQFTSFEMLADTLNYICSQDSFYVKFEYDSLANNICAVTYDSSFNLLKYFKQQPITSFGSGMFPELSTYPTIQAIPCPITEPDISDILNPDSASIDNLTVFDGDAGELTTDDVLNTGASSPPNDTVEVPSINTAAIILNAMSESGAIEYGINCFNFDCVDLPSLATGITDDSLGLNTELNNSGINPPSWHQGDLASYLGDTINQELENLDLVAFLNSNLGLTIPYQNCDGDTIAYPENGPNGQGKDIGNPLAEVVVNPTPGTDADQNYFTDVIAGLGLDGPGAAAPSPSALEMIKAVNGGVNLYNGSQNTSIPLYNLQAYDITIPVSISSSNNGLKVNDIGSLVGQHWNLDAGGMISLVVKGLPDEFMGKTTGIGVGRKYKMKGRIEIPSNIGLRLTFPGSDGLGCGMDYDGIITKIKEGFPLTADPIQFGAAKLRISWAPIHPNLINYSLSIPWFSIPLLDIEVAIEIGFNAGFSLNEQLTNIKYEEEGTGYFHHDNSQITNLSSEDKSEILQQVHSGKWIEDVKFFNDQIGNWDNWIQAIKELLGNEYIYETKKMDTQPDEFFFNCGGYSGKFIFNASEEPITFPNIDGLEIITQKDTLDGAEHIAAFTINTPDGMSYSFGNSDFTAVDITQNTNYYLPNFYTYEEESIYRDKFGDAQIDIGQILYNPVIGPKRIVTYGNTYNRNYRIMAAPKFSSAWHLTKVKSRMTHEEVELGYESRDLNYYADKSYTHTFPNFNIDGSGYLTTNQNTDLNDLRIFKTKWENGRAEFAYSVTESNLERWHLTSINTSTARGEALEFHYGAPRGEIVDDFLCDSIVVKRGENDSLKYYKGWKLFYDNPAFSASTADCDPPELPETPERSAISITDDTEFHLGNIYNIHWSKFHTYFYLEFGLGCFTFPIRINIPYGDLLDKDWGYRTHMSEYGSLMEIKDLIDRYDEETEQSIYNAEKQRSFLDRIEEIDRFGGHHDFITKIDYEGIAANLPKRFSLNQDLFGYYNDNSASNSPLPPVEYRALKNGQIVDFTTTGIERQFPFSNTLGGQIHLGQKETPDSNLAVIGALKSLEFASGGRIQYSYGLNVLPPVGPGQTGEAGAGLRVIRLEENPGDSPAKITHYVYDSSSVINMPIRVYRNSDNYYYPGYEHKVITTSSFQNDLWSNKSNQIGYGMVTESWDSIGIGHTKHYFTTPDNFLQKIQMPSWSPLLIGQKLEVKKSCVLETITDCAHYSVTSSNLDIPPALDYPETFAYMTWLLGVEYQTETYNADSSLRQLSLMNYDVFQEETSIPSFFQSEMYQNHYHGKFIDNYVHGLIRELSPFKSINGRLLQIYDLIKGNIVPHPFKEITKNYYLLDRNLRTNNIRLISTYTLDSLLAGPAPNVTTNYSYVGTNPYTPKTITTIYSGDVTVWTYNDFAYDVTDETSKFSQSALDYLKDSIGYLAPIVTKTSLDSVNITQSSFTALTRDGSGKVVPLSNWTWRDSTLREVGQFSGYNGDGKPTTYKLTKHDNTFFDPISLVWNDQLQLTQRSYQGFSTNYAYNTYFELSSTNDPDSITTAYYYDPRARLDSLTTLNGRQRTKFQYNIGAYDNYVRTDLSFADGEFPNQVTTQYLDGFGKELGVRRENDGAQLSRTKYDNFFRVISDVKLTRGENTIVHEASPASRWTEITDAVGNITLTEQKGSSEFFALTCVTDPNTHLSQTHTDGLGRTRKNISGAGGITTYSFDNLGRLSTITNPVGEEYSYKYNAIDRVYEKKVPGSGVRNYWWDVAYRPKATQDANGNIQIFDYDALNRITLISKGDFNGLGSLPEEIVDEDDFDGDKIGDLLSNTYEPDHTWLKSSDERILYVGGLGDSKLTQNGIFDNIGRPDSIVVTYPNYHKITSIPSYTDAGLLTGQSMKIEGPQTVDVSYTFGFDDILRPTETALTIDGASNILSRLAYNSQDLVKIKYLGEAATGGFLQQVDYDYDAAGKLISINSIGEMECFEGDSVCTASSSFCLELPSGQKPVEEGCDPELTDIRINEQYYEVEPSLDLTTLASAVQLENLLETALDYFGLFGDVFVNAYFSGAGFICFEISITNTNAEQIQLFNGRCEISELALTDCCDKTATSLPGGSSGNYTQNSDLFYEKLRYDGLDIDRIDMSSNCTLGGMRNEYSYDGDHRVTVMNNTFFTPEREDGRYNTNYSYDPAGNITDLLRNGWIQGTGENAVYGMIDSLSYKYANERLDSLYDKTVDSLAQSKGFEPAETVYSYDGNGNITEDAGRGMTATYNLLNLPKVISKDGGSMLFEYTFGGKKYKKETTDSTGSTNIRLYLGGVEFVNDTAEVYHHGEGRVYLKDSLPRFQYKIDDHLGNLMVFFEDRDEDGLILTESETSNLDSLEVMQRELYYPFGLNFEGVWVHSFDPNNNYLYNGKELEKDLGLNWSFYGFRMYDATFGRFTGVDPIADRFPWVSTYNYAENDPVKHIDLHGLQKAMAENHVQSWTAKRAAHMKKTARHHEFQKLTDAEANEYAVYAVGVQGLAAGVLIVKGIGLAAIVKEGSEAIFEEVTGIPVISLPTDLLEKALKEGLVKLTREQMSKIWGKGKKRPYLRKSTIEDAFEQNRGADGFVRDPDTGEIIEFDDLIDVTTKSGREYQQRAWDMGHTPGNEYWRDYERYEKGEISWDELKELYNDASRYRPETRATNRSHKLEQKDE